MKKRLLTLALASLLAAPAIASGPAGVTKNIILFIGDGMQLHHEIAASRYLYGKDTGLSFHGLPEVWNVSTWDVTTYNNYAALLGEDPYDPQSIKPAVGYDPARGGEEPSPVFEDTEDSETYFLDPRYATDSASAATAWATGHKTDDGNIAWLPGDPDDGGLPTIAELLRDHKGFAIGVVSTVPFTHATPAAHVSHNKSRNCYTATSRDYCERGIDEEILLDVQPDVVIGAGAQSIGGYIAADVLALVQDGDVYRVAIREEGANGALALLTAAQEVALNIADEIGPTKLFGLYGGPGGNFESPVPHDLPGTPLVTPATVENPLLAEATLAALKVLSQDEDGFFLMVEQGDIDWANHANDYARMIGTVWDLHQAVQATIDFVNRPGDDIDWDNTLVIVNSDHGNSYMRLNLEKVLGAGDLPAQDGNIYPDGEVTYGTGSHTNELVRLYAKGADAKLFERYEHAWYRDSAIIDNTHMFHVMMEAAGYPVESPLTLDKRKVKKEKQEKKDKRDKDD